MTAEEDFLRELQGRFTDDDGYRPNGRIEGVGAVQWERFLEVSNSAGAPATELGDPREGSLQIQLDETVAVTLFPSWSSSTIWFDFDVRTIDRPAGRAFLEFLHTLGQAVGGLIRLSYEAADDAVFAVYDSTTRTVSWTPAGAPSRHGMEPEPTTDSSRT